MDEHEQETEAADGPMGPEHGTAIVAVDDNVPLEFDVCEDGGIVSEHGDDVIAAVNAAIALKVERGPNTLVTILLSIPS